MQQLVTQLIQQGEYHRTDRHSHYTDFLQHCKVAISQADEMIEAAQTARNVLPVRITDERDAELSQLSMNIQVSTASIEMSFHNFDFEMTEIFDESQAITREAIQTYSSDNVRLNERDGVVRVVTNDDQRDVLDEIGYYSDASFWDIWNASYMHLD